MTDQWTDSLVLSQISPRSVRYIVLIGQERGKLEGDGKLLPIKALSQRSVVKSTAFIS